MNNETINAFLRIETREDKEKIAALLEALERLDRAHKKGFIDLKNFRDIPTKAIRKHKGD